MLGFFSFWGKIALTLTLAMAVSFSISLILVGNKRHPVSQLQMAYSQKELRA